MFCEEDNASPVALRLELSDNHKVLLYGYQMDFTPPTQKKQVLDQYRPLPPAYVLMTESIWPRSDYIGSVDIFQAWVFLSIKTSNNEWTII